jgi:hypothetical protein
MSKKKNIDKLINARMRDEPVAKAATWLADRMGHYELQWSVTTDNSDGEILCRDHEGKLKKMHRNHVRSILRRDYIEHFGNMPYLCAIIDDIIDYGIVVAKRHKDDAKEERVYGRF